LTACANAVRGRVSAQLRIESKNRKTAHAKAGALMATKKDARMTESCNRRLRNLLAQRKAVLLPGAANALAARVIEDLGFEAIYVTGAGVTNTFLGMPDIGVMSVTELASHVSAMRDVVALPLIVDADTGFGNPINVARTIQILERSGANAIQLEDQDFPKRCGHFSGKSVVARAEMVQKIHAAVDARVDPDLVIVARTDAIAVNGFDDAMERAAAYIEAGADMTFVEAPRSRDQIAEIPKRLAVPQFINIVAGGLTPMIGLAELEQMGYSMVLYANAALQASIAGMQKVLGHLKAHGSLDGVAGELAGFTERQRLVGKPHFDELEKKYT
jgi:2-methylisocitrate lyase-like PEP mutase family enzyme